MNILSMYLIITVSRIYFLLDPRIKHIKNNSNKPPVRVRVCARLYYSLCIFPVLNLYCLYYCALRIH